MKCDELKDYDYDPNFPFQSRGRFFIADEVETAIAELKKEKEYIIEHTADVINGQERELRRQKCKRCIAYADSWRSFATFCGMQSTCHNHRGFGKTAENWSRREIHAWKCVKRWLAIAEKYKTNSTAQ